MKEEFDKLKFEVQATENALHAQLDQLKNKVNAIEKEISTLVLSEQTAQEKLQTHTDRAQELNAELTQLKKEHQDLELEVEEKTRVEREIAEEVEEMENQKIKREGEIGNLEREVPALEHEINELNKKIADIKEKLLNAEKLYQEKVASIEDEIVATREKIETRVNTFKILRHLLEEGYISDSRYDVIKVLKQPGVSTIDQLVLASGVGKATVQETLMEFSKRGIVEFDQSTGKFNVIKEFSI